MAPPQDDVHPARDPLAGTTYRAVALLGRGTMGQVFEADHAMFGRVVVKLLRAELAERSDLIDRMRLEAEVLTRLDHPNIVRFLEFGSSAAGRPFLAMERLFGATLREELSARGRLDIREAITIAQQTLAGLSALHAMGVVHRDIKPANLFLSVSGDHGPRVVKILDLGVAKVLARGEARKACPTPLHVPTAPGAAIGTPRFLSPELIRGRPLDERADLYAVGLVLYTMLVGKGPFDDFADLAELLRAHIELFPPLPSSYVPGIPRRLDLLLMKALAKRPEDRFGSAAEFRDELTGASAQSIQRSPALLFARPTAPLPPPAGSRGEGITIPLPPRPGSWGGDRAGRALKESEGALEDTLASPAQASKRKALSAPARRTTLGLRVVLLVLLCILITALITWFGARG